MSSKVLHISTDKTAYAVPDDVKVTATIDGWYPGPEGKARLVIWVQGTNNHIADEYVTKPTDGFTVHWTVPSVTFEKYIGQTFDAQIEFGVLHADYTFTH